MSEDEHSRQRGEPSMLHASRRRAGTGQSQCDRSGTRWEGGGRSEVLAEPHHLVPWRPVRSLAFTVDGKPPLTPRSDRTRLMF